MNHAQSLLHPAHRFRELFRTHVFQQVSQGSGLQRPAQISSTRKCRDDDDTRPRLSALELNCNVEAGHVRHFNVGDEHVRLLCEHRIERFFAVTSLAYD